MGNLNYTVQEYPNYNLVTWTIQSDTPVILSRGATSYGDVIEPYVFGSAFFPIYLNPRYNFQLRPSLVQFPGGISFAFVFSGVVSIQEVFPSGYYPYQPELIDVNGGTTVTLCLGYPDIITQYWQLQTETAMTGYIPNPSLLTVKQYTMPSGANANFLYQASYGDCSILSATNVGTLSLFGFVIGEFVKRL